MCGADRRYAGNDFDIAGSPPRVRSRLSLNKHDAASPGITSACAEQTVVRADGEEHHGDHLRVCGADVYIDDFVISPDGSPPRVRSRPERSPS